MLVYRSNFTQTSPNFVNILYSVIELNILNIVLICKCKAKFPKSSLYEIGELLGNMGTAHTKPMVRVIVRSNKSYIQGLF